jgi:hypothetical protein
LKILRDSSLEISISTSRHDELCLFLFPFYAVLLKGVVPHFNYSRKMTASTDDIQKEVTRLNEMGKEFLKNGKLKSAYLHFNQALQNAKQITDAKKSLAVRNWPILYGSFPVGAMVRQTCQPLTIDNVSSPLCAYWESIACMALIHNSALVHMQAQSYETAKHLLELAISMMKREIRDVELAQLMSQSRYAASVIVSSYIILGKTLSRMLAFMPPGPPCGTGDNKIGHEEQAKKAFNIASGLMKRYLAKDRTPSSTDTEPASPVRATSSSLPNATLRPRTMPDVLNVAGTSEGGFFTRDSEALARLLRISSSVDSTLNANAAISMHKSFRRKSAETLFSRDEEEIETKTDNGALGKETRRPSPQATPSSQASAGGDSTKSKVFSSQGAKNRSFRRKSDGVFFTRHGDDESAKKGSRSWRNSSESVRDNVNKKVDTPDNLAEVFDKAMHLGEKK